MNLLSTSTNHARRNRGGMTLVEVMVVLALMLALMAILVPAMSAILGLNQRAAAKKLVITYDRLHDEAVLQNNSFRIIYDLDANKYSIEVGEQGAIIYTSTEQREAYEEQKRRAVALMSDEELAMYHATKKPFDKVKSAYKDEVEMPRGVHLAGVYTPQYGKMMTVDDLPEDPEDGTRMLYSYVFGNGFTEHTVIWITDIDDEDVGWTIVVEPLSGKVQLMPELIEWEDTIGDVPEDGPDLPS